ncbi:MAG: GntR family transcriptional regulator [Candidatus Omnitrophica bacterium]|nr:GntR family transcriptional regulator [Candidatus Omnitrophota bacterium]
MSLEEAIQIGRINRMRVVKEVEFGVYLDGGEEWGEILLPAKAVPEGIKPEDEVNVFLYFDSEDRIIATTNEPFAFVGDFAVLTVRDCSSIGTFLDWGIPGKDLFLPFREQIRTLKPGERIVVYVMLDPKRDHIIATMRFNKFLSNDVSRLKPWQKVTLTICRKTDMGYPAIINNENHGLLFANEVFEPLKEGDIRTGYIKQIREDGKIDLSLHKQGYRKLQASQDPILQTLEAHNGFIPVTDKSSPEEIYKLFSMSKKTYKKTVGTLFKRGLVSLDEDGIRLLKQPKA